MFAQPQISSHDDPKQTSPFHKPSLPLRECNETNLKATFCRKQLREDLKGMTREKEDEETKSFSLRFVLRKVLEAFFWSNAHLQQIKF